MQQETMMSVHRKLAEFRFDSRLTTWLFVIIRNKFNDTQRKINQITKLELPPKDSPDDSEDEENIFRTDVSSSPLEVLLILEELDEVKVAIEEFIGQHRNQERNRRIITMVLFENRTCEDTAKILGINAPVVSYVVRDVRKALREKFPDRTWHLIGKLHKFDR
jgi:RNA polymerase sigma factor (sigma-70 family)